MFIAAGLTFREHEKVTQHFIFLVLNIKKGRKKVLLRDALLFFHLFLVYWILLGFASLLFFICVSVLFCFVFCKGVDGVFGPLTASL